MKLTVFIDVFPGGYLAGPGVEVREAWRQLDSRQVAQRLAALEVPEGGELAVLEVDTDEVLT